MAILRTIKAKQHERLVQVQLRQTALWKKAIFVYPLFCSGTTAGVFSGFSRGVRYEKKKPHF
jgi:hypothetical protein